MPSPPNNAEGETSEQKASEEVEKKRKWLGIWKGQAERVWGEVDLALKADGQVDEDQGK